MKLKLSGILLTVATLVVSQAVARPVTRDEARLAARAFAARGKVFGARLGAQVEKVDEFATANGGTYFAVKMAGGGTLVTTGDTEFEPVIAILPGEEDITTIDKASPLWVLLDRDFTGRQNALKKNWESAISRSKWARLVKAPDRSSRAVTFAVDPVESMGEISDLRVAPLVKAQWNQSGHGENQYTPNNYVCGCVATAMSQIMHYFQWPQAEIEPFKRKCAVDGVAKDMTAMGGVYDWANMPNGGGKTVEEKQAVGKLTYDCGVSVSMDWGSNARGGSGAVTADVSTGLKNCFGYASAKTAVNYSGLITTDAELGKTVYSCLDVGSPVQFGISRQDETGREGGHSIVGDGYGFIDEVSYVHINMGWGGSGDAWYHLPNIDGYQATQGGSSYQANTLETIIYNIFPEATGCVLSGRAVDDEGHPLANAEITIQQGDAIVANVLTSETGVWGVILPDGKYEVTGVSTDGDLKGELEDLVVLSGVNSWGNNLELTNPSVRNTRTGESYSTLNRALLFAETNDTITVFGPTTLKKSVTVAASCTIVAEDDVSVNAVRTLNHAMITVPTDVTLTMTNVCFVGQTKTLVTVESNATLKVAGFVDVGQVELKDAAGLDLAGEIAKSIYVVTPNAGEGEVFVTYSCDPEIAKACAMYLVNPANDELGGIANDDGTIKWGLAPVPDDVTSVRQIVDGESTNYRTLEMLVKHLPTTGDVRIELVKDASLSSQMTITNRRVVLTSATAEPASVNCAKTVQFICQTGSELVLKDVTVKGVMGNQQNQPELFKVDGGKLTLQDGATIRDHYTAGTCSYGAVALISGEVTLQEGSQIVKCRAGGSNGQGGGIRADAGTLNLLGGSIVDCESTKVGRSVYVFGANATVNLAKGVKVDELYVFSKDPQVTPLKVVEPLTAGASIGINHLMKTSLDSAQNALAEGSLIATVADGVTFSDAETEATRRAFINTKHEELGAEFSGQTLVWGEKLPDPPEPGLVRVIQGAMTNEFMTAEEAFASITTNATVMLLADVGHDEPLTVAHTVTLTSDLGGPFELYGTGSLEVKGGALTLTDVSVAGPKFIDSFGDLRADLADQPMIYVEDGSLTLAAGARVNAYMGVPLYEKPRNDLSAIVLKGSTFTMLEGSVIEDCYNFRYDGVTGDFYDGVKGDSGCGAAVYAYNVSTVNLWGGKIMNCWAEYGAVFLQQGSKGVVRGDFTVKDNTTLQLLIDEDGFLVVDEDYFPAVLDWHDSDLVVGESSTLEIVSPLTGSIGRDYAVTRHNSDTNYVAQVSDWRDWVFSALTNSVTAFFLDTNTAARAVLVTNATDTALVVWSTAIKDGVYTAKDGTVYSLMGEMPEPGPGPGPGPGPDPETATPEPIAFTKIAMSADNTEVTLAFTNAVQWCNYAIFGTNTLTGGFVIEDVAPVTNFQWQVTEPKVEITLPTNGNLFWKATAAEGLVP